MFGEPRDRLAVTAVPVVAEDGRVLAPLAHDPVTQQRIAPRYHFATNLSGPGIASPR
jgi:hypothetical protein